ncbi:MAG: hypothetical protein A2033_13295, partial [Bacteroidetes bacterium GWA2_31_9]
MVKYILLILFVFEFVQCGYSQNFNWANSVGSINSDNAMCIELDDNENVYATGRFSGTVDFDSKIGVYNLTSIGLLDAFIAKYDKDGNLIWAKSMGGTLDETAWFMKLDDAGNIYIIGTFISAMADFDPSINTFNLTSLGSGDIFFAKYSNNGDLVWAKAIGSAGNEFGRAITLDSDNNIYITGYFSGTADFNPNAGVNNLISSSTFEGFLAKYDNNGNYIWAHDFGNSLSNYGVALEINSNEEIVLTGFFSGTVDLDFDVGLTQFVSAGGSDIFVAKYDTSSNLIWANHLPGKFPDAPSFIQFDSLNNIYLSGSFKDTIWFDDSFGINFLKSPGPLGNCFLASFDNNGSFRWSRTDGGKKIAGINSFKVVNSEFLYLSGNFQDTIYYNNIVDTLMLVSNGLDDILFVKYKLNGELVWVKNFGGTGAEIGRTIAVSDSLNAYLAGYYQNTVDFNPNDEVYNLTSSGNNDLFISKYSPKIFKNDNYSICNGNFLLFGDDSLTVDGSYTRISNCGVDCDSIITANITVLPVNDTLLDESICEGDIFNFGSQTLTISGVFYDSLINIFGCDSTVTLNLTVNPTFNSTISEQICNGDSYLLGTQTLTT